MDLHTFSYHLDKGWSVPQFPLLSQTQQLVVVFGAPGFFEQQEPLATLAQAYPQAHMIGCSTAGEIHQAQIYDHSISVAAVGFDKTSLASITLPSSSMQASYSTGRSIAQTLLRDDLRGVLVLSDGLHVNGSELIKGLNEVLPAHVKVTGGLAGDGDRFGRTWVLKEGQAVSDHISAVGMYGDAICIGHGSKGGWDIFGPERRVTHSEGNILYTLDQQPALALYKEYLGERAKDLPASGLLFPLSLRIGEYDEKALVRTILAVNEETQSLTFAGDIPTGSRVRLMKANFDRLIQGAEDAAHMTQPKHSEARPTLAIAISCVGRRLVLGARAEDEVEATLEAFSPHTQQIGFYSYGEISPYSEGHCDLHNQTMTLTTICEK